MLSSLPLANLLPFFDQRTHRTGPVCIANVHKVLGIFPARSVASLRIGFVDHMRILQSMPPVAIREPSGWTSMVNIERRLLPMSFLPVSVKFCSKYVQPNQMRLPLCITHAGFVNFMKQGFRVDDRVDERCSAYATIVFCSYLNSTTCDIHQQKPVQGNSQAGWL